MKTADALMVVYYVVLSGVLVFTLGYLAGWRHAKRRQIIAQTITESVALSRRRPGRTEREVQSNQPNWEILSHPHPDLTVTPAPSASYASQRTR